MARLQRELSGELGAFWKTDAEKRLESVRNDIATGDITIDEDGIARNKLGRVVMNDMLEMILLVNDDVNEEATKAAREAEVKATIEEYRRNYTGPSAEALAEMRSEFAPGSRVVNLFTGTVTQL